MGKGTVSVNQSPQYPSDLINYPSRTRAKRSYKAKNRAMLNALKEHLVCEVCGHDENLIFHHRDPETKSFNIGCCDRGWDTMVAEIEKCDVLCRYCHADAHEVRRV